MRWHTHSVTAVPHSWPSKLAPERAGTVPTGHSPTAIAVSVEVWHRPPVAERKGDPRGHGGRKPAQTCNGSRIYEAILQLNGFPAPFDSQACFVPRCRPYLSSLCPAMLHLLRQNRSPSRPVLFTTYIPTRPLSLLSPISPADHLPGPNPTIWLPLASLQNSASVFAALHHPRLWS